MKYDSKKVTALANAFKVSRLTITRWADKNDPILTSEKAHKVLQKFEPEVPNTYQCGSPLWRKFKSNEVKNMYNSMMGQMINNQNITCHPDSDTLPEDQWQTICHNVACYAAWALQGQAVKRGTVVINVTKSGVQTSTQKIK